MIGYSPFRCLFMVVDDPRLNAQLALARTKLVFVTIGANDDPYGVLDFVNSEQEVAEDYNLGDEGVTSINVTIERQQGLEGNISVSCFLNFDSLLLGRNIEGIISGTTSILQL